VSIEKLTNFEIFISTNKNILDDSVFFLHKFLLLEKKSLKKFNISENNISSVKATKGSITILQQRERIQRFCSIDFVPY
jgi:uncharacterized membrane protein YobD (UPF0266 family)